MTTTMMTTEEKLKRRILSQFKSIRDFASYIDMPYTTVKSILSRGVLNSNVGNVTKICNHLNISVDALIDGKIQQKRSTAEEDDGSDLNRADLNKIINYMKYKLYSPKGIYINDKQLDQDNIDIIVHNLDYVYDLVSQRIKKSL